MVAYDVAGKTREQAFSCLHKILFAGVHIRTGEEVGIKLVSCVGYCCECNNLLNNQPPGLTCLLFQEKVNAFPPQLLYESKLYKILQGEGKACWSLVPSSSVVQSS